ncbi:beta-ketoacyl-ACP synthase, partial [Providencia burhodogranariea DSM 19968]
METKRCRVVVTGMGVLSSLAENISQFEKVLFEKKCNIKKSKRYLKWF